MLRLLIGGSLALLCCFQLARGQCPFNHSPWGALFLDQPRQLTQAENVYPGEYVEVNLVAGQCYRVVVIDTFGRAMQLVLTDSLTRPLARAEGPPGQALQMSWQFPGRSTRAAARRVANPAHSRPDLAPRKKPHPPRAASSSAGPDRGALPLVPRGA